MAITTKQQRPSEALQLIAEDVLDFVEPGPLLSDEVVKPPTISKATVQRYISNLSPYCSDEQLDQVVEMFKTQDLI